MQYKQIEMSSLCKNGKIKVEISQLFGFFRQFLKISGKKSPILSTESTESTESTDKKVPGTRDRVVSPVLSVIPKPNPTLLRIDWHLSDAED